MERLGNLAWNNKRKWKISRRAWENSKSSFPKNIFFISSEDDYYAI